ncbi:1,4-dihydroxy-2-naphthoyl-CoA synthase [Propionibacterium sp.]|uniref:1,4-dihydroxy-2-naphthoyl-CoA synthase n=1 Tax=Propionibacterium sp. TaxID=1977903 RepID=UPI0039EC9773
MSFLPQVSDTFDADRWREVVPDHTPLTETTYHRLVSRGDNDGAPAGTDLPLVRIAIDRPLIRNAFGPHTVDELYRCIDDARCTPDVASILLTGNGPSPKDGGYSFCSGGDQRARGAEGYRYASAEKPSSDHGADPEDLTPARRARLDKGRRARLHILEVQRLMRSTPKPIIAVVPGWSTGGGHSLMVVCDLAIASKEHAVFKQVDANVSSFDAGYGSALLARQVGDKRARQIFFLADTYDADQAAAWGVINESVPHAELEPTAIDWGMKIASKSPQSIRMLKYAFNMVDDGIAGQQAFAGEATRLGYMTEEAREGRDAFLEHRSPDWSQFPYYF